MNDIRSCLERQLELSKELNDILSKVDLLEGEEKDLLYKENEILLKELEYLNQENVSKTDNKISSLKQRVSELLKKEESINDSNFYTYLINYEKELNKLEERITYLENNLEQMNEKHNYYVNNIKKPTAKEININKTSEIKLKINKEKNKEEKLEFNLGSNILNIIGVVLILIAFITFGKYVYTNYMNDFLKGISLFIVSSIILALGESLFKDKVPKFAIGISSLGVGGLYASLIINYLVLENINSIIAILLTLIITGISLFISKKNNSDIVRIIALIGGYGCLIPTDYLFGVQEYIVIFMLLIISFFNIYIPLQSKNFSIYSSILNVFFCYIITSTYYLQDLATIIYISATLSLNNFMYIKLYDKKDEKLRLGSLLTSLFLIMGTTIEYSLVSGIIFSIISLCSYLIAHDKLKNVFYIHIVSVCMILRVIYEYELGVILDLLIYFVLLLLTLFIMLKEEDKYLNVFFTILILIGLVEFLNTSRIIEIFINVVGFAYIIWKLCDKYKDKKLVIALKHSYLYCIISRLIYINVDFNVFIALFGVLTTTYILITNEIERLKHSTIKNSNIVILIIALIPTMLFLDGNIIEVVASLIIGAIILELLTNKNYIESEFINKNKLLIYSLYLTYGVIKLFNSIPLNDDIINILMSFVIMIVSLLNVWIGFKYNNLNVRKYGLILSLIICAKLILFDFYWLGFIAKTILFLVVGIIALVISYIYSKLEQEFKSK